MDQVIAQQIWDFLSRARSVLILIPPSDKVDNVAAALALRLVLIEQGKDVVVAGSNDLPSVTSFLPGSNEFKIGIPKGKTFIINLDTGHAPLGELSYHTEGDQLKIFLVPKSGEYAREDVSFAMQSSRFDCIVCLGGQSLEQFGKIFQDNADLFYETPRINIDISAGNTFFGSLNMVDATYAAVSELLADLLLKFSPEHIKEDIATCLLAGIIASTNSFQFAQTTPRAFLLASELVKIGGRQQEIVHELFKTRPLPFLQLWGRALARLKPIPDSGILFASLSAPDFAKTNTKSQDIRQVLIDLIDNVSGVQLVVVAAEEEAGKMFVVAAAGPQYSLPGLALHLGSVLEGAEQQYGLFQIAGFYTQDLTFNNIEERITTFSTESAE